MGPQVSSRNSLTGQLNTLRRMNIRLLRCVVESMLLLYWHRILVAYLPYESWKHKLLRAQSGPCPGSHDTEQTEILIRAFNIARRNIGVTTTCLQRSLALHQALERRHIPARLVIGLERGAGFPGCHAWVEANGVALLESPEVEAEYLPFSTR